MRAEMRAASIRLEAKIDKARTTEFRILLSICLTTALGTIGLVLQAIARH